MRRFSPLLLLIAVLLSACATQPTPTPRAVDLTPVTVTPGAAQQSRVSSRMAVTPQQQQSESSFKLPVSSIARRQTAASVPSNWAVLLNDDFKTPDPQTWDTSPFEGGKIELTQGELQISANQDLQISTFPTQASDLQDGYIAATFTVSGAGSAGVMARYAASDADSSMYICLIAEQSSFACYKRVYGSWVTLIAANSAAIRSNQANTLALQIVGTNLLFAINDLAVASFNDGALMRGSWGIFAQGDSGAATAHFTRVIVAGPGSATAIPTPLPAGPTPTISNAGRVLGLDPSFGAQGKTTVNFGSELDAAQAVVTQPDGKIVIGGEAWPQRYPVFALTRLNADGALDTSFGDNGKVLTSLNDEYDYSGINALALQPDGKLVAAGYTRDLATNDPAFGVVRYNSDGSLDTTFGSNGKVILRIDPNSQHDTDDEAEALAIQADGKIVLAGVTGGFPTDFGLARLLPNGSVDNSFGKNGRVITDFGYSDKANALLIQPDGKIVAVGYGAAQGDNIDNYNFALARYNSDGSLDTKFGSKGKVLTDVSTHQDEAHAALLRPDGKIVVGGLAVNGAQFCYGGYACWRFGMALAQYDKNGKLDSGFGDKGKVIVHDTRSAGYSLLRLPDGTLALGGFVGDTDFGLALFSAKGVAVPGFGSNGILSSPFGIYQNSINAIALQSDNSIVAAGSANVDPSDILNDDFAIARFK